MSGDIIIFNCLAVTIKSNLVLTDDLADVHIILLSLYLVNYKIWLVR